MVDSDPVFLSALEAAHFTESERTIILEGVEENHGSLPMFLKAIEGSGMFEGQQLQALERLARVFVTAHDVTVEQHVRLQAAFQKFNDSATSKTINAPESATVDDVLDAYMLAWETGCKGITYYRDGSRSNQPLSTTGTKGPEVRARGDESSETVEAPIQTSYEAAGVRNRPEDLYGFTRKVQTADGRLYLAVNYDGEGPREVVASVGRSGGTLSGLTEAIGRLISLALQYRVPVEELAKQLLGIRGPSPSGFGPNQVLSIPDAIGKVLKSAPRSLGGVVPAVSATELAPALGIKEDQAKARAHAVEQLGHSPECPECHTRLTFEEGCRKCHACGYSACS
ncbi:Vitamin B12-dependent ribonucleotide reductase [compost metagenome]